MRFSNRRIAAASGLMLLAAAAVAAVAAENKQAPPTYPRAEGTVSVQQPAPAPPEPAPAPPPAPALVVPAPVQPPTLTTSTVLAPIIKPIDPPPPPLGSELRGKIREDEKHFNEKSSDARRHFELRQADELKDFEATLAAKGFWERRRVSRAFGAEQAAQRREFLKEQAEKRKLYEWRFP